MTVNRSLVRTVWISAIATISNSNTSVRSPMTIHRRTGHNVVAASAVVGLVGREGMVIRKTLWVFGYYALFSGALGYAIVWWATKGPYNIGSFIVALIVVLAIAMLGIASRKNARAR